MHDASPEWLRCVSVGWWMILLPGAARVVLAPMLSPMLPLAGAVGFRSRGLRFGYFADYVLLALGPRRACSGSPGGSGRRCGARATGATPAEAVQARSAAGVPPPIRPAVASQCPAGTSMSLL